MTEWTPNDLSRPAPPVLGHVAYALTALGLLTGFAALVGALVAWAARQDSRLDQDWIAGHYDHVVRVVGYGLAGFLVASLVTLLLGWVPLVGWLAAAVAWLALVAWYAYQVGRGWLAFANGRPVEPSREAWLIL